jgi:hypothetical protein
MVYMVLDVCMRCNRKRVEDGDLAH